MKSLTIKLSLVFIFLFAVFFAENSFLRGSIIPIYEHISVLGLSDKAFLRIEQGKPREKEALFIERIQIRLHKTIHQDEDSVFKCEGAGNTECFVSATPVNSDVENSYLEKCLVKGVLPKDKNSIAINESLLKRMNLSVGDTLCLKSAVIYQNVTISGIIRNFYGFPDFKADDVFYFVQNRGVEYQNMTVGGFFDFSDSKEGAFLAEDVSLKIQNLWKRIANQILVIFFSILFLSTISFQFYKRILQLPSFYSRLYALGKTKSFVKSERLKATLLFALACLLIVIVTSVFGAGIVVVLFNSVAILLSSIINFFLE